MRQRLCQYLHLWIGPEPILILTLVLMSMLIFGVNDATDTNVFLSSVKTSVNATDNADY